MKPENSKKELEALIKKSGTPIGGLTPAEGVRLMLDFYRDVRAEDCPLEEDGDMLLFQWGTHDSGEGETFQLDITRQFIHAADEDDDGMSQLSLTFHFKPTPELTELEDGNQWCNTPEEVEEFEKFIMGDAAYEAVADVKAVRVGLEYGGI